MLSVSKNKVRSANFDRGFGTESIGVLARYYAAGVAALGRYRFPTTELFSEAGLTEQTLQDLNQIWIDCADFIISCDNRRQRLSAFFPTDFLPGSFRAGYTVRHKADPALLQLSSDTCARYIYENIRDFADAPELEYLLLFAAAAENVFFPFEREIVELCVTHNEIVLGVVSKSTMWRADGTLQTKGTESAREQSIGPIQFALVGACRGFERRLRLALVTGSRGPSERRLRIRGRDKGRRRSSGFAMRRHGSDGRFRSRPDYYGRPETSRCPGKGPCRCCRGPCNPRGRRRGQTLLLYPRCRDFQVWFYGRCRSACRNNGN